MKGTAGAAILGRAARGGLLATLVVAILVGCGDGPWNNPYRAAETGRNSLYGSFAERPKHLDPARSYSANEYAFIGQIYEPPLQYHFLLRPYRLIPLVAEEVPEPLFFDAKGEPLPPDAPSEAIALSEYRLRIRPGISYQPHPAFVRGPEGDLRYHRLGPADLAEIKVLGDFREQGTRELVAEDFVYQIKRLADPAVHSPIAGLLGEYIEGFSALGQRLGEARAEGAFLDLREFPFAGAEVLDRYSYRIRLRGRYQQFVYWLAMPFFAPMPWEADRFYAQPGLRERNISLDWYPVGTGPYRLTENNPNLRMVLERNPSFHGERYPEEGMPEDQAAGLLGDAGQPLPFIERASYSLEKENIPYWYKFLQGYYDSSGISSDSFDQAIVFNVQGEAVLSDALEERGIGLLTSVETSVFYLGFNLRDPLIGGEGESARLLRRAISIAVDYEEYVSIFANGRGVPAQGPIPPGIFGHREGEAGINPYVYRWEGGRAVRRGLDEARALVAQAGFPGGRDPATGEALNLYFDVNASGPDDKARLSWMRKQFQKLGIQLVIRATDYNRFQEKMREGTGQLFLWGWNADYPDPENFLFLLYGPNSKATAGGENAANYRNPQFDALFDRMKDLPDGPVRQGVIDEMLEILRRDAPWVWGYYPKAFSLHHAWVHNLKPNLMANNTLKYRRLDPALRERAREAWNPPLVWPLLLAGALLAVGAIPAVRLYRRREQAGAR